MVRSEIPGLVAAGGGVATELTSFGVESLRLLAQASEVLGTSLNYRDTLRQVAQLAVPALADVCTVDVVEEHESVPVFRRVAVAHAEPSLAQLVRKLADHPPDIRSQHPAAGVLRTGRTAHFPRVSEDDMQRAAADEPHLALMRKLRFTSALGVPLSARGATLGVLSLIATKAMRYDDERVRLAEELAKRCAVAVDNARLYENRLAQLAQREEHYRTLADKLQLLNELGRAVTSKLDSESIFNLVVHQLSPVIGSLRCSILKVDPVSGRYDIVASHAARPDVAVTVGTPSRVVVDAVAEQVSRGQLYVCNDTARGDSRVLQRMAGSGLSAVAVAPIEVDGVVWGALATFFGAPAAVTPPRRELLAATASYLAVALTNAQLYSERLRAFRELQCAQGQIVQQERLRALGEMASGIAHDFNNSLGLILGFADLALEDLAIIRAGDKRASGARRALGRSVRHIREVTKDTAAVVARLQEFYRPRSGTAEVRPVRLDEVARRAIAGSAPRWRDQALAEGRTISVKSDLQAVPPIQGDRGQLREALTNLLFNAVDALPDGGRIGVRVYVPEPLSTEAGPGQVVVEVADTGRGMADEVRRRCLEPFFTTKGATGSGLGLSMVHGTVKRHAGTLEVESALGQGTTVTLAFPLEHAAPTGGQPGGPVVQPAPVARRTCRRALDVLAVDDEPLLCTTIAELLGRAGHRVRTATSGAAALAEVRLARPDVVLTDRAMPGMSGDQLAAALKALDPRLPVIMLTGFGHMMRAVGELPAGVDLVLAKPAARAQLLRAVCAMGTR